MIMSECACVLHVDLGHDAFRHCVDSILWHIRGEEPLQQCANMCLHVCQLSRQHL